MDLLYQQKLEVSTLKAREDEPIRNRKVPKTHAAFLASMLRAGRGRTCSSFVSACSKLAWSLARTWLSRCALDTWSSLRSRLNLNSLPPNTFEGVPENMKDVLQTPPPRTEGLRFSP
jgi:hypothetical protein